MRQTFSVIFMLQVIALIVCAYLAKESQRKIGGAVALLLFSLIPPLIGNLIIISTSDQTLALVGSYIYFLGMDMVMFALLKFSFAYCHISWKSNTLRKIVYLFLVVDAIQLLLNPVFGHAFTTEAIIVDGYPYFRMLPLTGQTFHRVLDYSIFLACLCLFLYKAVTAPAIYSERYSILLLSSILCGLWETYYIFSRTPIDRSMIGFGVFGLLVFFFSIYYRPIRLLDKMLANIASNMTYALFCFDAIGVCIWANRPGRQLVSMKNNDYENGGSMLKEMFSGLDFSGENWNVQHVLGAGEDARYYEIEKQTIFDNRGRSNGSFMIFRDNTEDKKQLEIEKHWARHDTLTDLYNKDYLIKRIREKLDEDPDTDYMVSYLDVKDFKILNDVFGSEFGDYTLKQIADFLRSTISDQCIYGRLGGDKFGIFGPIETFNTEMILKNLDDFKINDGNIEQNILIHLGIYEITERDLDVSVMIDRAHMALQTIKDEYHVHIAYYDETMRNDVLWNQHISMQLHQAIAEKQIRPYFQPIVDTSGKTVGAEALVRWIHPTEGFLNPGSFIPVFEKNGMIVEVDRYMWRCACEQLRKWDDEGRDDIFISVNISPKDFYFMDVAEEIKGLIREFKINPARLRIEITETVMMSDIEKRMDILADLKNEGFIVEMDDFGSGYSSLNLLKDMPVDVLKIDMAFLKKTAKIDKAKTIVHNIINMSGDLGIESLTEGVETETQYAYLSEMGCRLFQGYYFAKPMPLAQFEEFCFQEAKSEKYS